MNVSAENQVGSFQIPNEQFEANEDGDIVESFGTYFEIINSSYLNVTLLSSENVHIILESVPKVISIHIKSNCNANSTELLITGLETNKKYYRYQDGNLQENFTTTNNGSYKFTQDISTHHHIFIQETESTIYIRSDGSIEPETAPISKVGETYTLTNNIGESLFIQRSGITLDGDGYSISGSDHTGIYVNRLSGVTVKNVQISGLTWGIHVDYSTSCVITQNTLSNNNEGMRIQNSNTITINDNTASYNTGWAGIFLYYTDGSTVSDNIASYNTWHGILLRSSESNIVNNNNASYNNYMGITVSYSDIINIVRNNTAFYNENNGIRMTYSNSNIIHNNTISNNNQNGIHLYYSNDNTISNNTALFNGGWGNIFIHYSDSNEIMNNTASNNINYFGIGLNYAHSNTLINNTASNNNHNGILVYYSNSNTLSENTVTNNFRGIVLDLSNNNNIINNTASYNRYSGIYLQNSDLNIVSGNIASSSKTPHGGIKLEYSSFNIISSNTALYNDFGIVVSYSDNNIIIENLELNYNRLGIFSHYSNDNIINGNMALNNAQHGIYLWHSSSKNITNNTALNNGMSGIILSYSYSDNISGNIASNNAHHGISISYSQNTKISNNTVSDNAKGIYLAYSNDNIIFKNIVLNNEESGIHLIYSNGSTIYNNNIVNNMNQIYRYLSFNAWDNGAGEGNYWSDYTGLDDGSVDPRTGLPRIAGDGVGDTDLPHQGVDWYPLTDAQPNTDEGPNVEIFAGAGVEMNFSEVTSPGFTYAKEVSGSPPAHFRFVPVNTYYDISTTASFTGIINISISYDDTSISHGKEKNLKLMHWDEITQLWVDITTWVDTVNNTIYGETYSLSIFAIMVENEQPTATITGPVSGSLYKVGTKVTFTGTFTDTDTVDTHTAKWTFTSQGVSTTIDGTVSESGGSGSVSDDYTFTSQGVYTVTLTVTDNGGVSDTADTVDGLPAMVVIYDPEGGFVTGGGWINSLEGAYIPSSSLSGKASFGFVAKYKKGTTEPIGNTEFKFEVADLDFHSTDYKWLVVAGAKAQFKGTGTINDQGEYKFIIWATDGALVQGGGPDKFRIKIWEEDEFGVETVIYDNKVETELGGGNIVIHKA